MPSKAKLLARNLGGHWTYDGMASWWCDDDLRHVSRCCGNIADEDNSWTEYWLYGTGMPERAERYIFLRRELPSLHTLHT